MFLSGLAFYIFAAILVGAAAMVITARNPVHSVFYLILAFFNAAGLFVLVGAEFVAMTLIIVYVGAVAVLFLFVVMMLDVNFAELRQGVHRVLPVGVLVGLVLLAELIFLVVTFFAGPLSPSTVPVAAPPVGGVVVTNTEALGRILYTEYVYAFQVSGLILLVAMVGAIVLTLRRREDVRRQEISQQVTRPREQIIAIRKVPTRGGV